MKTDTRMILAPLTALAVAFGAYAFSPQMETFESSTVGEGVAGTGNFCFSAPVGVYDESTVANYAIGEGLGGGTNYLAISTDEGTLFRSINDLDNNGVGAAATVGAAGVDIDMSMQFTVTAAGEPSPEAEPDDKLLLWLQDEGTSTNLLARGGLYTGDPLTLTDNTIYRLTGVAVVPGNWYNVKIKAFADISGGSNIPGFQVLINNTAAGVETALDGVTSGLGLTTYIPSLTNVAELAAVGFSGDGAVDDISIVDNAIAGITVTVAGGAEYTEANGSYTFTAPSGSVIASLFVNGAAVAGAAGQNSYNWTAVPDASVVVTAAKLPAAHPWYENPVAVVLAENLPEQTGNYVSAFHGQGEGEYLGLTYSTNPLQFDLFEVDGTEAPTTITSAAAGTLSNPGLRGVAISKALGIAMTLGYDKSYTMYAFPLAGGNPTVVAKSADHAFDAGAFSPDGKYFFSNAIKGESSNQFYVKWTVSVDDNTGALALTKVGSISAGGRGRCMAYAKINGRDLVFGLVDTGKIVVIDMTGDDTSAWTAADLITDLPTHSYGTLCVSGVNTYPAAPKLTVATANNNGATKGDLLNVYALTVPASGTVTQSLVARFDENDLTAAGFGDISDANRYGNTVYVTDDEATIYFARPDAKLYAAQYTSGTTWKTLFGQSDNCAFAISNATGLATLKDGVAAGLATVGVCFKQTANIDMASAGAFAGIGTYNSAGGGNPATGGVSFCGTYDGQGYKISNVTFTDRDYAGIFNQVNGGTIQNLTVENLTFVGTGSKYCASIIGNAGNGATLRNLVSAGSFGSAEKPGNHNMAGIAIRLSAGGTGTLVQNCTNNAAIYGTYTKLAGICALTQTKVTGGAVTFDGCVNNGTLTMPSGDTAGRDGLAGIVGYASDATVLVNCSNTGAISSTLSTAKIGELVGYSYAGYTLTDQGGNSGDATKKLVHTQAGTINGFKYATVDNGVATTVTTLEAGKTYLLEGDVAASETPVFTFDSANTISFDTALGYTFAGSVAIPDANMYDLTDSTSGTVTTYTAAGGTAVATITKNGVETSYNTLQKAIAAAVAESVATVNLGGAASGAVNIPAGITVQLGALFSLADVTTLAGEGVLAMPWGVSPQSTVQLLCQQTTWAGTLLVQGVDIGTAINLTLLGNANSTVRFNNAGCAFTTGSTTVHAIKALEIGPDGLDLIGNYSAGTFTFPCALTGTGNLKIAAKNSQYGTDLKVVKFTGDVSGFTGSISFDADANCAVYFGEATGNGNCISVAAGTSVTVAAGKTWTAPAGFVVNGNMTVNGTLAGGDMLYGAGGTVTFTSTGTIPVGQYFTGTYNANFNSGNGNSAFYLPISAGATTIINGSNGTFCGYPRFGDTAPAVAGPIVLNANWVSSNGYSRATTTFAKLSGTGDLLVEGTDSQYSANNTIPYSITELDNYTGTLGGRVGSYTIGKVNVTTLPANGACVVKTAVENGTVSDNVPLYVDGVDTGKTLTYDANGAEGAGLYYVAGSSVVVPVVSPGTNTVYDCGTAANATTVADTMNGAKSDYIVAPVDANLSGETATAYANLFTARADGANVVLELNAAGTNALETAATNAAAQVVSTANLAAILSVAGTRSINVTGVQPGFYYSVVYDDNLATLDNPVNEGGRAVAGADGSVALPIPSPKENATAGFYRVLVNIQDKAND